jgi:DNA adenine methylase
MAPSIKPPLKWHGGKSYLAKWILEHFPDRQSYTHFAEPFAGGLAVLLGHDPEGKSESVNDLNGELSNFWQVLQHPALFREFSRLVEAVPLSEVEWRESFESRGETEVERAKNFLVLYRQSRQSLAKNYVTPTRRTRRGMNEQVSAWLTAVDGLPEAHERLRKVEIRSMDAIKFIEKYDHKNALFYCDPPYLHSARVSRNAYEFEMTDDDHLKLLDCLKQIKGKFLLSGYPNELYARELSDCTSVVKEIDNKASSAKIKELKTEHLWMNYEVAR